MKTPRLLRILPVVLAACGFDPTGLAPGDPDGAVIDAAPADDGGPDAAATDARTDARTDAAAIDARVVDAPPIDSPPPRCPPGYGPLGTSSSSYRVVETTATWDVAAADCNDDDDSGGYTSFTHLIVVGNDAEKAALTVPPAFSGNTWVGLTDAATENTFLWVTLEPTGGYPIVGMQPPWDGGDPDGGTAENCVRFKNSFDFEDKDCASANSYVCECDDFAPR